MANQNFISYVNSPIYLGTQEGQVPATGLAGINNLIAANSCDITFDAQLEGAKFLGKTPIPNDFNISGPKQTKISFSYVPLVGANVVSGVSEASLAPFFATGDSVSGSVIRVGNFIFRQCYLDSLSVQINAYNPVKVNANYSSYDSSITETGIYTGAVDTAGLVSNTYSGAYLSSLHALSLGVSGNSTSIPESKTEISIQTTCARTPIYEVGSITPTTVILNSVNRSTNLNGENVGQVINFSGSNASLSLRFSEFSKIMDSGFAPMTDYKLAIDILGKVSSQNLSMQPNQILGGSCSVVENIF